MRTHPVIGAEELINDATTLLESVKEQHFRFSSLVSSLVKLQQRYRLEKNYVLSDEVRALLNSVGVKIIQGTAGYDYDKIPAALRGRPVGDTWTIE